MPETAGGSSGNEGDEPSMLEEDLEKSPLLLPIKFRDADNAMGYAGFERIDGKLRLKQRSCFTKKGSIIYV